MDIFRFIKDNVLIICPVDIKYKLLEDINAQRLILNVKFMTIEELYKKIYFDYDIDAIIYLMRKYKIKYDVALTYLNNMYYIDEDDFGSTKLKNLINMKNDLLDNDLLILDNLYVNLFKQYDILFYGYPYYKKKDYKLISFIKGITNVIIINNDIDYDCNKILNVYEFKHIDEEINYILYKIINLIEKGISLNNIKLCIGDSNYIKAIRKIFKFYDINTDLDKGSSLYDFSLTKCVISLLHKNEKFTDIITKINENRSEVVNKIIAILNKYIKYSGDTSDIVDVIIKDMKRIYLDDVKYTECIKICDFENSLFNDEDYVFVLGFNNGNFPIIKRDDDYISDNLKIKLGMSTSLELNDMIRNNIINRLFSLKNISISYKLNTYFETFYPSTLIDDYNFDVIRDSSISMTRYSKRYDEVYLANMLDKYLRFGIKNVNFGLFYNDVKLPYLKYDNAYKKIDNDLLLKYLNNRLVLSYSSVNDYYHCKFKYLLKHILKVDKYEDNFSAIIGSIFHYVLSHIDDDNFNLDLLYEKCKSEYELDAKQLFYLDKLKKELVFVVDAINNQQKLSGFNDMVCESKFVVNKSRDNIDIEFKGFADKIVYDSKNKLLSIIDYKTGGADIDLGAINYGINMQLPSYIYLVKNNDKFKDYRVVGIYLQKILNSISQTSKDYYNDKLNSLKLGGYSNSDKSILEIFDTSYENSEMIKGMKLKKDGSFYNTAKILDDMEIDKLISITDRNIDTAIDDILNSDFTINPKRLDGINIGCEFCNYRDICFRKEKDIVDIEIDSNLGFLQNEL